MDDETIFRNFETPRGEADIKGPNLGTRRVVTIDSDGNVWEHGPTFPSEIGARFAFSSKHGGWVPSEVVVDSLSSNAVNYGQGAFEGEALRRTVWGDVFVQPEYNSARLTFSGLAIDPTLIIETMKKTLNPETDHLEHVQRTGDEFFRDASKVANGENGGFMTLSLDVVYKNGAHEAVKISFGLRAKVGDTEHIFSIPEMDAIPLAQAYLNGIVRCDENYPPESVDLIYGAYQRRVISVSAENGTKIPAISKASDQIVMKPFYLSDFSFPWGQYLSPEGYKTGIPVLVAPYMRIDETMPVTQKISGNYINSQRNVHWAVLLGCGEILACNHEGQAVEGSAENLVFLFSQKKTGELRAYFPPLSSNVLAGTNRARMLRVLEEGLHYLNRKVELILEAPSMKEIMKALKNKSSWSLDALVMFGTGVKVIHVNELRVNEALRDWGALNEMSSEESMGTILTLYDLKRSEKRFPIFGGKQHPFVPLLTKAHDAYVIGDNGSRVRPPYDMDYYALGRIMGVDFEAVAEKEFVAKVKDGCTKQRINGIAQPDELKALHKEAMRTVFRMNEASIAQRCTPFADYAGRRGFQKVR